MRKTQKRSSLYAYSVGCRFFLVMRDSKGSAAISMESRGTPIKCGVLFQVLLPTLPH